MGINTEVRDRRIWYLKDTDEVVYGPYDYDQIISWVRETRLPQTCRLSIDQATWLPPDEAGLNPDS